MSDPSPPPVAPVPWVIKRDGRQAPFEADKISRSLFAASEELDGGDAFLCRELTDGILHFMAQEFADQTPTTKRFIADLVVKVVRELGHPALAQQYLKDTARPSNRPREHSKPWGHKQVEWLTRKVSQRLAAAQTNPQAAMEDYLAGHFALSQVYTADLVAVHTDGLIDLGYASARKPAFDGCSAAVSCRSARIDREHGRISSGNRRRVDSGFTGAQTLGRRRTGACSSNPMAPRLAVGAGN